MGTRWHKYSRRGQHRRERAADDGATDNDCRGDLSENLALGLMDGTT
jgi:hypothetical protein